MEKVFEKTVFIQPVVQEYCLALVADDITPAVVGQNVIPAGVTNCRVGAVTNGANDFIVLPDISLVADGTIIKVLADAGANFEVRTPATFGQKINGEDSDGTKEMLATDHNFYEFVKLDDTRGWMARSFDPVGTVVSTITPHS